MHLAFLHPLNGSDSYWLQIFLPLRGAAPMLQDVFLHLQDFARCLLPILWLSFGSPQATNFLDPTFVSLSTPTSQFLSFLFIAAVRVLELPHQQFHCAPSAFSTLCNSPLFISILTYLTPIVIKFSLRCTGLHTSQALQVCTFSSFPIITIDFILSS